MAIDHDEPDMPDVGDQAFVRGLLATGMPLPADADLDAPVPGAPVPMPDEVWTRLERALHAEAAQREADADRDATGGGSDGAQVIDFASAAARRRPRSATILAVAAVGALVFGGAVVVQTVQSRTPDPVAADAAVERSAVEVGSAASTDDADAATTNTATTLGATTAQQASTSSPSRRVMASGVDYKPKTMADQVSDTLTRIGAANAAAMDAMVASGPTQVGTTGFTATADTLRACIDEVVAIPGVQALVVDRAHYRGADAAIIVIPEQLIRPAHARSADGDPLVHVYVVEPECEPDDVMLDTTVEVDR